jgi:hypothetical protein
MTTLLPAALAVLAFALLSLRPATTDARTWADYRAHARTTGLLGCVLGALRVGLVAALLVLNDVCRLLQPLIEGARIVLGALAYAVLYTCRPAVGGAA